MTSQNSKTIHLPWHQRESFWMSIYPKTESFAPDVRACLEAAGFIHDEGLTRQINGDWTSVWAQVYGGLQAIGMLNEVDIALVPDATEPALRAEAEVRSCEEIEALAQSMWLGDALIENRLMCYLQPVLGGNDKVFGYESFARVKAKDGSIIGGNKIIAASKVLGIEFMIDRWLHVEAVKTFVGSDFNGFLFINFFPGFIHRPAVYMEGLSETVKGYGIVAKHVVLDFTNSETPRDIRHLNSVCDYARSRGYSIALDDIASLANARRLVPEIKPDFLKIDMQIVQQVQQSDKRELVRGLVEVAHQVGCSVIAEGVETSEIHEELKSLGVDLFQGYLFSPPVPVETALARSAATGAQ